MRVLVYPKFRLDAAEREALLADYLPFGEIVSLPDPLPDLPAACRDRNDAVFLHLAIASRAELLISGDDNLAVLSAAYPVASPAELRRRLVAVRLKLRYVLRDDDDVRIAMGSGPLCSAPKDGRLASARAWICSTADRGVHS